MAWALSLASSPSAHSRVTEAQLAELDDYELACRSGAVARDTLLRARTVPILHALVCVAGAQNSRTHMLRSVSLFHAILPRADPPALHAAVCGLAAAHVAAPPPGVPPGAPTFLHPLVTIAVTRVADKELSALAADALAAILGCVALEPRPLQRDRTEHDGDDDDESNENAVSDAAATAAVAVDTTAAATAKSVGNGTKLSPPYPPPLPIAVANGTNHAKQPSSQQLPPPDIIASAEQHTMRLIASLLTELALSDSSRALAALPALLRRDGARRAFVQKDGVSALASALRSLPSSSSLSSGATAGMRKGRKGGDPIEACYNAVFALWMLSFARAADVHAAVLRDVASARLPLLLAALLSGDARRQRLKIARVTLAALANLAVGEGELNVRVRRDLLAAGVPAALDRLRALTAHRASLLGADEDARRDADLLVAALAAERATMSTVDAYVAEVRAGAWHDSPVHSDAAFWSKHADRLVSAAEFADIPAAVADAIADEKAQDNRRAIACEDLARLMRASAAARRFARGRADLKTQLMTLMATAKDPRLRGAALLCVQVLMVQRSVLLSNG